MTEEHGWGHVNGGWCVCGHHSVRHDADGCTVSFCKCKRFVLRGDD